MDQDQHRCREGQTSRYGGFGAWVWGLTEEGTVVAEVVDLGHAADLVATIGVAGEAGEEAAVDAVADDVVAVAVVVAAAVVAAVVRTATGVGAAAKPAKTAAGAAQDSAHPPQKEY